MKSNKTHNFNDYELYPLNLCSLTVEENDVRYLHSELEKASSSLFVKNSDECQVEVFEAVTVSSNTYIKSLEESASTKDDKRLNQKKLLSTNISSLDEMQDVLRVCESVPNSMCFVKKTIEIVPRKYENFVRAHLHSRLLSLPEIRE